ncbi:MAG: hypothetical protein AB7V39_08900 [Nitrospiraceae bacterium]
MSRRLYVGPYIRCRTERKPQKITFWGCLSDLCDLIHKKERLAHHIKFCPHCGSPCGDTEVDGPEIDAVRPDKLYYETDERWAMFNAEYASPAMHIFVPNQDWPRDFVPDSTAVGEVLASAGPNLVTEEIEWLKSTFAEDLKAAHELYGDDKVEVCWGILGEYA